MSVRRRSGKPMSEAELAAVVGVDDARPGYETETFNDALEALREEQMVEIVPRRRWFSRLAFWRRGQ